MTAPHDSFDAVLDGFRQVIKLVTDEIGKVIVGQKAVLDQMLASIFSRGHCLLVGVPGLAKTMMVRAVSQVMDLAFKRIQFTPDLMPSDITGTNVLEDAEGGRRDFRFVQGPVFANIILADEINRTPPKTQAALLEAMQERQVTVGQTSHLLPDPFFVIATQNPIEQEGTYPLPEAQLDRFMFNIFVDYPAADEEERILSETTRGAAAEMQKLLNARQVLNMQKVITGIPVSDYVIAYAARIVRSTRPTDPTAPEFVKRLVDWGAGPRAGQYLIYGAKAFAAMEGRPAPACEDIRRVAIPVLRHRIGCNFAAQSEGVDSVEIVKRLLATVTEPRPGKYGK